MVFDHFKSFHNGRPPLREHTYMLNDIYNLQSPALFSEDLCHKFNVRPLSSPVVWCSFGCSAAPAHLWWACDAVLSPFLQEAVDRWQTAQNENDLTLSHSSCVTPSSYGFIVQKKTDYPQC